MPQAYPLQALLSVRHYREDEAVRDYSRSEEALKEAEHTVEVKKQELEAWRLWRVEETDRRYAALLGKVTVIEKIDAFNRGLSLLAEQELGKIAAVDEALRQVDASRKARDAAKLAAKEARKNTAKIETHQSIWTEEAKKEAEHAEDLELEEFKPVNLLGSTAEDDPML